MGYKSEDEFAQHGEFLRSFSTNYCVKCEEAFNIGRVLFEIYELKKYASSQKHATAYSVKFYLQFHDMRALCHDILTGVAQKKFSADADAPYPNAYSYQTGEKGCKHLNIGGGRKGCRIAITNNNPKNQELSKKLVTTVAFADLQNMAYRFRLFVGEAVPRRFSYLDYLQEVFLEGCEVRKKRNIHKLEAADMPEETMQNEDDQPPVLPARKEQNTQQSQTHVNTSNPDDQNNVTAIYDLVIDKLTMKEPQYMFRIIKPFQGTMVIYPEELAACPWIDQLLKKIEAEGETKFHCYGTKKVNSKGIIYVKYLSQKAPV